MFILIYKLESWQIALGEMINGLRSKYRTLENLRIIHEKFPTIKILSYFK